MITDDFAPNSRQNKEKKLLSGNTQPDSGDSSKNITLPTAADEAPVPAMVIEEAKEEEEEWKPNDDMTELAWFGPEDSDEEIEEMAKHKTPWEIEQNVKFSKRGLIEYIERMIEYESK